MDLNLIGKHALVCGSTQGIGKAAAIELASLGAQITLVARTEDKLQQAISDLPASPGGDHNYLVANFEYPEELRLSVQDFIKNHKIDILINNTGGPAAGPAIAADLLEYISAFNSHLICNQILAQAVTPGMKAAGWGRIINVISTSVKIPIKGLGVSNTIRGAVASWSKTLSTELAPFGITVNNVLPGLTLTARLDGLIASRSEKEGRTPDDIKEEMLKEIPAGRFAESYEIAAAIAFLASPAANYINGINITVDGGKTQSL
jgi:3-oxoacyl-[acyl-carrier protein] reductase